MTIYKLTAERPTVSKLVSSTFTDDYESALRIFDGAVERAKAFNDPVVISMYLPDGSLHQTQTVNAEVVTL